MIHLLSAIPSPPSNSLSLGPLDFRYYGLCIALGVLAAVAIGRRRWEAKGGDPEDITTIALVAVPAGLIGARLYHVITDWSRLYSGGRWWPDAFAIWKGGLGIPGGVLVGVAAGVLVCRRMRIDWRYVADAAAPAIPVAQAIGRLGNWFNQELYGGPTDLPWGLRDRRARGLPAGHHLPPDVPLRGPLEPGARRADRARWAPLGAATGPLDGGLRRRLRARSAVGRVAARRRGDGVPRLPGQHVDLAGRDRRRPALAVLAGQPGRPRRHRAAPGRNRSAGPGRPTGRHAGRAGRRDRRRRPPRRGGDRSRSGHRSPLGRARRRGRHDGRVDGHRRPGGRGPGAGRRRGPGDQA